MSDILVIDYGKSKIKAAEVIIPDESLAAEKVSVSAGGDITAADLQTVLEALDTRISALENA